MNIEFNVTLDDTEAFSWYYYSNHYQNRRQKRIALAVYFVLGVILVLIGIDSFLKGHIVSGVISFIIAIFAEAFIYYWYSTTNIRRKMRKQLVNFYGKGPNDVTCNHKFSISPDGLVDITEMGESTARWGIIENIVSTDKHIFLTMTGGSKAYIVPKTAFSDDTQIKQFLSEAEDNHNNAMVQQITAKR